MAEMTTKSLQENVNFGDIRNNGEIVSKGGDSITPLTDTKNIDFVLEGIEFWQGQGVNPLTMVECKIDYLTFNIPSKYICEEYEEYLLKGLIEILRLENDYCDSKYNYSEVLGFTRCVKQFSKSTTIIVNDTKRENKFLEDEYLTRIELKGQGCRDFESRGGNWKALLNFIIAKEGYITRLDLAIDDKVGYLTPTQLNYYFQNRYFKSIFKEFTEDSTLSAKDKINKGWGVLFGSKHSSTRLRIYDKKLEMISKGEPIDNDIEYWIRYELRFLHDKAKSIIYSLKENILNLEYWGASLLRGCLTILSPNRRDTNRARWKICKKWNALLKNLENAKVKVIDEFKRNSNYATMKRWIETSCTKSLVINDLINADDEKRRDELELKLIGLLKLTNVDLNMINKERSYLLGNLTMNDIQNKIIKTNEELYSYHNNKTWKMFKEKIENMFHSTYEYLINACKLG